MVYRGKRSRLAHLGQLRQLRADRERLPRGQVALGAVLPPEFPRGTEGVGVKRGGEVWSDLRLRLVRYVSFVTFVTLRP